MTSPDLLATFPSGTHSTIESFIRTLSGEASIGIFLADPEGHTLYLNGRLRLMAWFAIGGRHGRLLASCTLP